MRLAVNSDEDEPAKISHASRRRACNDGSAPGSRWNGNLPNQGVMMIADENILNYESSGPSSPTEAPSRKKGKKASSGGGARDTMNLASHLRVRLNLRTLLNLRKMHWLHRLDFLPPRSLAYPSS